MKYEFLDKIDRFYVDEIGWFSDVIEFPSGYGIRVSASSWNSSTPKIDLEDIHDYSHFEVAIVEDGIDVTLGDAVYETYQNVEFDTITNPRLKEIINEYNKFDNLAYVPVEKVQEIYDIMKKGSII